MRHLAGCKRCTRAAEEQRALGLATRRALAALDVPLDLDAARAALERRMGILTGAVAHVAPVTDRSQRALDAGTPRSAAPELPAPGAPARAPRGEGAQPGSTGESPPTTTLAPEVAARAAAHPPTPPSPVSRALATPGGTHRLARAAVVVIAFGAVASALPGSPVRTWLAAGWQLAVRALRPDSAPAPAVAPVPAPPGAEAGVRVEPSAGQLRFILTSPPGTEIRVRFTDDELAAVYAAAETRFRTGPGLVHANVAGPEVRLEIPRAAAATLEVNGRLLLRKAGDRIQLLGPGADTAGAEIRFRAAP